MRMLSALLSLLSLVQDPTSITRLQTLAKTRDVASLDSLLVGPKRSVSPFRVLKTNGPYETGRFGWVADALQLPNGERFVVFGTKITSECAGELLCKREGKGLRYVPEADDMGVRIKHQDLVMQFDPTRHLLQVENILSFVSNSKEPYFAIRMSPSLRVQSVKDEVGRAVPFAQARGITFLKNGASRFRYRISYEGVLNAPDFAGSINPNFISLVNDYWYPMIARQEATYTVQARVPEGFIAVGQGERMPKSELKKGYVGFRMNLPTTYWSFSAGPFRQVLKGISGREFGTYTIKVPVSELQDQADLYSDILKFYESSFGKYPFETWSAVLSPVYGSGALEMYSGATYGNEAPGEDAHETAHTWFGGIVGNSYLHSLWNESFAAYCEKLYLREVPIGNRAERRAAFVSHPRVQEIWNDATCYDSGVEFGPSAAAQGYGKGGFVLQQLEREIGTEAMLRCMRRFVAERPTDRTAEWDDFEAAVAKELGSPRREFFDQWLRRKGYPDFKISDVRYEGGAIVGKVSWKEPYQIPMDVLIEDSTGVRTFQTAQLSGDQIRVPVGAKPKMVSFDPWRALIRRISEDESPASIAGFSGRVYRESQRSDWRPEYGKGDSAVDMTDPAGCVLVGSPETWPALRAIADRAGLKVSGDFVEYDGTKLDLSHGTATALVRLANGKYCLLAMGKSQISPNSGDARLCLADNLGRFLRGVTEPKTSGNLTYRFN